MSDLLTPGPHVLGVRMLGSDGGWSVPFQQVVNMDGQVKYTGIGNDRDPILVNIGGNVPTNVRTGQVP